MAPRKGAQPAHFGFHRPESDFNPQVMVTPRHSLTETLRFAEVVYACVKARNSAHIDWAQVSDEAGMEPAECMRLWRFIAYHWKGPFGHKQSDVEFDKVDLDAESDPEGAVEHATAVVIKGRGRKQKNNGQKRSTLPVSAHGFTTFSKEFRQQIKDADPSISFGDIAKELGRMWRGMTDAEKAVYIDKAAEEKRAALEAEARRLSRKTGTAHVPLPPVPRQSSAGSAAASERKGGAGVGRSGAPRPQALSSMPVAQVAPAPPLEPPIPSQEPPAPTPEPHALSHGPAEPQEGEADPSASHDPMMTEQEEAEPSRGE